MGVLAKNVLEHVGGKATINPELVIKNAILLKEYNISLTSESGNGYTVLGMENLSSKLDYLIENYGEDLSLDDIDRVRNISNNDNYRNYKSLQNGYQNDRIDDAPQKFRRGV